MKICTNCGAPLRPENPNVCAECGAEQHPGASRKNGAPPRRGKARRARRRLTALAVAAVVLFVLLAASATATTFLYNRYNPDDALDALGGALLAQDIDTLRGLVQGGGVTDDGLRALCRAFATQESVDALKADLLARLDGEDVEADSAYSALTLTETPVFLGYSSYHVTAQSVSLLLTGSYDSPTLTVDGAARSGTAVEGGVRYDGFFPGVYTVTASAKSITGQTLTGAATDVTLLDADAPVAFSGGVPVATVTVSGCTDDSAAIFVDGTPVAQRASGGVVTIPGVAVGSTISMEYTAPHGAKTTASVQFTDLAAAQLAFANHVTEGGVPAEADLNALLGAYYASYLDCINNQDMAKLVSSTELNRARLSELYNNEDNLASAFTFESAAVNYASAVAGTYEELPSVVCDVVFRYKTTGRADGAEASHESYQTCELVYQDGAWLVNRAVSCTKAQYDAAERAALE